MKTARATSAGGVVLDHDGRVVLLAVKDQAGKSRWVLPKGAVEPGESPGQAAVREVREETGLDAEVLGELGVIDYWFVWKPDDTRYHKFVHYFAMRATGGDFSRRDQEAEDVAWFDGPEAFRRCAYANEREMVGKALASFARP